jgi:hypothetical protein
MWSPCGGRTAIVNLNTSCSLSPTRLTASIRVSQGTRAQRAGCLFERGLRHDQVKATRTNFVLLPRSRNSAMLCRLCPRCTGVDAHRTKERNTNGILSVGC